MTTNCYYDFTSVSGNNDAVAPTESRYGWHLRGNAINITLTFQAEWKCMIFDWRKHCF